MNNWKQNEAFKNIDSRKQRMIEILINSLNGKELKDALPILSNWKLQLKKENISFTKQENDMLADIFIQELSPSQRKQYEMLKPLLHTYRKQ